MPLGTLHLGHLDGHLGDHLDARIRLTQTATGWKEVSAEESKPGPVKITRGPGAPKQKPKAKKRASTPKPISVTDLAAETTQFIVYAIEYLTRASEEIEAGDYASAFGSIANAATAIMASRVTMETVIEQEALHGYRLGGRGRGSDVDADGEKALKLMSQAAGYLVEASKAIHGRRYDRALDLIKEAESMVRMSLEYVEGLK